MSPRDRALVERYLDRDPDLRSAVFALRLLDHPYHAQTLLGMALRAGA